MVKCTTLCVVLLLALTTSVWGQETTWQRASAFDVAPRSTHVVLVHQLGADLGLQLRSSGGVVLEQDGPDDAFGTEVIVLENRSSANQTYELFVRAIFHGVAARYDIERISDPNAGELKVSRAVSSVGQQWLNGAPTASVLPIIKGVLDVAPGRLRGIAINTCLDILVRSGHSPDVIEFLQKGPAAADRRATLADETYRDYQLASALWESVQLDAALELIAAVAKRIQTSAQWPASVPLPTRRWLELQVDLTLGAARLFAGRARGDRKLMQEGGDLLAATLRAANAEPDLTLRARATEFLAGYYNFVFDRSSNVPAELYVRAAQLYESAGDRRSLAVIRNNQAFAELGRGNIETALRLYLETLELQRTSRHIEGQAHVRARLGYLYYTIGDYRRAEVRFKESIELYRQIKLSLKLVHTQLQLAELLHSDRRSAEALALLNGVRAQHAADLSIENALRLATQRAAILVERGDTAGAERALAELSPLERFDARHWSALQVSVRLFHLIDLEIVRARIELAKGASAAAEQRVARALVWLGEDNREPLQQLQLLHMQLAILERRNDEQRFAEIGERALALIESIRGSIDFHTQGPAWSARTSQINEMLVAHHLALYEAQGRRADFERAFKLLEAARARNLRDMRASGAQDADPALERSAREVQQANQALIAALLLERPTDALARQLAKAEEQYQRDLGAKRAARAPLAVLDSEALRGRLDAQTQARLLFGGDAASYMIVINRDGASVERLPKEAELHERIQDVHRELASRTKDLTRTRELARVLFPESDRAARPSRLLIETAGVFSSVPFSILLDVLASGRTPPAVTVVPSLSEMFTTGGDGAQRGVGSTRKDLVVFADPAFGLSVNAIGDETWRRGFSRLPYSTIEAKAISAYFEEEDVLTFTDRDATIANVTSEAARSARVLHIAAHGFGSTNDPFLVGLGLAKTDASDTGLLTTQHISTVRYENELIVVSACESGQGQLLDGEGLMSVARSFLASGAKATLSTLWPVPDRANAQFMKEFYRALAQLRTDPAAALVIAQQKMKATPQFDHPYYWGGFILHVADGRYRPIATGETQPVARNLTVAKQP